MLLVKKVVILGKVRICYMYVVQCSPPPPPPLTLPSSFLLFMYDYFLRVCNFLSLCLSISLPLFILLYLSFSLSLSLSLCLSLSLSVSPSLSTVHTDTQCHIHFPDSNRYPQGEKSDQVSITGSLPSVESARIKVRVSFIDQI